MKMRGRTPRLLMQTPLYERGIDRTEKGINQPSHIERDTPLTLPSPLRGLSLTHISSPLRGEGAGGGGEKIKSHHIESVSTKSDG